VWNNSGLSSAIRNWLKVNPAGNAGMGGTGVLMRYMPSPISTMLVLDCGLVIVMMAP
jgi:hypothetical protein